MACSRSNFALAKSYHVGSTSRAYLPAFPFLFRSFSLFLFFYLSLSLSLSLSFCTALSRSLVLLECWAGFGLTGAQLSTHRIRAGHAQLTLVLWPSLPFPSYKWGTPDAAGPVLEGSAARAGLDLLIKDVTL